MLKVHPLLYLEVRLVRLSSVKLKVYCRYGLHSTRGRDNIEGVPRPRFMFDFPDIHETTRTSPKGKSLLKMMRRLRVAQELT